MSTAPTDASVDAFIEQVIDPQQREDSRRLIALMSRVSGHPPMMWGPSIIGFDSYHYRYESGREGHMCTLGFSPRSKELAIYFVNGLSLYAHELANLGPHRPAKSCLYVRRLDGVDLDVLTRMLEHAYADISARHGEMGRAQ